MGRSDHGKSRDKREVETDNEIRGPIGPFLKCLSGYNAIRTRKYDWSWMWMNGNSDDMIDSCE